MAATKYIPVPWTDHARRFYTEWLLVAGLKPDNVQAFDKFVALAEERMGDWLMDPCLDFSGLGLTREDEE